MQRFEPFYSKHITLKLAPQTRSSNSKNSFAKLIAPRTRRAPLASSFGKSALWNCFEEAWVTQRAFPVKSIPGKFSWKPCGTKCVPCMTCFMQNTYIPKHLHLEIRAPKGRRPRSRRPPFWLNSCLIWDFKCVAWFLYLVATYFGPSILRSIAACIDNSI